MRSRVTPRAVLVSALAAAIVPRVAHADDKEECISVSVRGQQLREDGQYRRAREAFTQCARDACPALVKADCIKSLAEVDQLSPTIVVSAKDEHGADLVQVRVLVDSEPLVDHLDGKPAPIDPGEHRLRYETAGHDPVEEHVVIHAGEKARLMTVRFPAAARVEPQAASHAPLAAWIFAGAAVAAFGSEAYFGLTGISERDDLPSQPCANTRTCDVDPIRTRFLVADVSLGVGVLSAAIAAYLFLASH